MSEGLTPLTMEGLDRVSLQQAKAMIASLRRQLSMKDAMIVDLRAQIDGIEMVAAPVRVLPIVSDCTGLTIDELRGPCRNQLVARSRMIGMVLTVEARPDLSYPAIGRLFGRDHTVVLHALETIHDLVRATTIGPVWAEMRHRFGLPADLPDRVRGRVWTLSAEKVARRRASAHRHWVARRQAALDQQPAVQG